MLAVGVTTFRFLTFDGQPQEGWALRQFGGVLNSFEDCLESVTGKDLFLLIPLSDKMVAAQTPLANPLFHAPTVQAADPLRTIWADPKPAFVPIVFRSLATRTVAATL